jgi:hypothetical protein
VVRGPQARSASGDCAWPPAPAGHCEIGPVLDFSQTGDDLAVMRADYCPHRSPSVTFRTMLFISLTPSLSVVLSPFGAAGWLVGRVLDPSPARPAGNVQLLGSG